MKTSLIVAAILAVAGVAALLIARPGPEKPVQMAQGGSAIAQVVVPDTLSADAQIGKTAYEAKCAACHGVNAAGQDGVAPPLVHKIYEPSHHADEAFQRAAAFGVQSHHWRFGNMPPVKGVTRADVTMIVAYVRALQRANGIN